MRLQRLVMVAAVVVALGVAAGSAAAEGPTATVRTQQGVNYALGDAAVEVYYSIGELKAPKEERQKFGPAIVLNTTATAAQGEQAGMGQKKEEGEEILRGRREVAELPVWRQGVAIRVPVSQIRSLNLSRTPVSDPVLPPYVPLHRYAASVELVTGERLSADYVNWGTAVLKGSTTAGTVRIPWEDVVFVAFER